MLSLHVVCEAAEGLRLNECLQHEYTRQQLILGAQGKVGTKPHKTYNIHDCHHQKGLAQL